MRAFLGIPYQSHYDYMKTFVDMSSEDKRKLVGNEIRSPSDLRQLLIKQTERVDRVKVDTAVFDPTRLEDSIVTMISFQDLLRACPTT